MVGLHFEHEIPDGSRLYFGKSAKLKRYIEGVASDILSKNGFEEIVTPCFSYHQHLSVSPEILLRFSDPHNHDIALRADSTLDAVRIIRNRIKDEEQKRWFYIQPIFKYPSSEFYQIGAEILDKNLTLAINLAKEFFKTIELKPVLQLSNIEIPKLVSKILDIDISVFEKGAIEILLDKDIKWLNSLASVCSFDDLKALKNEVPSELVKPIDDILNLDISYSNIKVSLLYYSKMRYYDELFFRFIDRNSVLCSGGDYKIDEMNASGFAIMSDNVIENLIQKENR